MKTGILYFHQGWTDIINCLALINHYNDLYETLHLIIRKDSKNIVDFYIKNLNIIVNYIDKNILDNKFTNLNIICQSINVNKENIDFIGIGFHDKYRNDKYKKSFNLKGTSFEKCFYIRYDIPYITRVNKFEFVRNIQLEEQIYDKFIKKYGTEYILYHEVIENYDNNIQIVNLNKISDVLFDMIKVLENAIEIHLLDSVWGAFIYLLDAKYKLFQNKKIILYAKRGYNTMFIEPIKLDNWIIC